jgi:hypothetical protein
VAQRLESTSLCHPNLSSGSRPHRRGEDVGTGSWSWCSSGAAWAASTAESSYPTRRPGRLRDADLATSALPKAGEEIGLTGERVELLAALPAAETRTTAFGWPVPGPAAALPPPWPRHGRESRRGGAAVGAATWHGPRSGTMGRRPGRAERALATALFGAVGLVEVQLRTVKASTAPLGRVCAVPRRTRLAGRQPSASGSLLRAQHVGGPEATGDPAGSSGDEVGGQQCPASDDE